MIKSKLLILLESILYFTEQQNFYILKKKNKTNAFG